MGLVCVSCGLRFYLPPGEQVWREKHCGGSILKPGLPQYCIECMERRFSRPVSKANQTASRDGAVRMPTGEKEDVQSSTSGSRRPVQNWSGQTYAAHTGGVFHTPTMYACTHARARTHARTHVASTLATGANNSSNVPKTVGSKIVPTVFESDGPGVRVVRFAFLPAVGRAGMARKALWRQHSQAGAAAVLYRVYGTSLQ